MGGGGADKIPNPPSAIGQSCTDLTMLPNRLAESVQVLLILASYLNKLETPASKVWGFEIVPSNPNRDQPNSVF